MEITVRDIQVEVLKKDIKNLYLNVLPPDGRIRVSAPFSISDEVIKLFVIKKYRWIKKHVEKLKNQERQTKREYITGESHYFKGQRYIMKVEKSKRPRIEIRNKKYIYYFVPSHYTTRQKQNYYENWLRKELKRDLNVLMPKWENIIGVKADEIRIKKMKTKWGSCNPVAKRIWINLELIKKPKKHLEYVIAHELIHLLERKHNERFKKFMTKYMPQWKLYKKQLNELIL